MFHVVLIICVGMCFTTLFTTNNTYERNTYEAESNGNMQFSYIRCIQFQKNKLINNMYNFKLTDTVKSNKNKLHINLKIRFIMCMF